jgi:hypothetical protein
MSVSFDQIPESVWQTVAWFESGMSATPPDIASVRATVGLGLLYGGAVNWLLHQLQARQLPAHWGSVWVTNLGMAALVWWNEQPPKAGKDDLLAENTAPEQLPPAGTSFAEKDVPADFREGGKPKGKVLTTTYLADMPEWNLLGPYLSKNYGPEKPLTTHIKVGRTKAYLFKEVAALRTIKTANEAEREKKY